jgi:tetratricopeptide (TPR) repeat protein
MNSPKRSCGCEVLLVQPWQLIQFSLLVVITIVLVTGSVNAQDTVALNEKTSSRPLISARVYFDKANALGRVQRWQQAAELYLEALRLDEGMAQAHNNLGHAFVQLGRLEDAADCFERAVKLQPEKCTF